MNPFEMVVLIVLIVTIGQVIRAKVQGRGKRLSLANDPGSRAAAGRGQDAQGARRRAGADRHRQEPSLEQEIERLRDR